MNQNGNNKKHILMIYTKKSLHSKREKGLRIIHTFWSCGLAARRWKKWNCGRRWFKRQMIILL